MPDIYFENPSTDDYQNRDIGVEAHATRVRGHVDTPDSTEVTILNYDASDDVERCEGATLPNSESDYAEGCWFYKTDSKEYYINTGTNSSAQWSKVNDANGSAQLSNQLFVAPIGGFNATQEKYLFAATAAGDLSNVVLVSDTATTGSDGSNNYTFQVRNLTQANDLLSAVVTTNANEIGADTAFEVTPDQNQTLAQGDVIELQITKNGTATDLSSAEVIATMDYIWQ